jgi:hypothetical protein
MTRPNDCVIAFALPTTEQGFKCSVRQRHSEYVHRFAGGWEQYRTVCEDLRNCINQCRKIGVQIVEEVRFDQWQALFQNCVVALFAHWISDIGEVESIGEGRATRSSDETIELWDCQASADDLVSQIPDEFDGVLDLSVCHPFVLVDKIKRCRRKCTVKYFPDELLPSVWAEMYIATFRYLEQTAGNDAAGGSSNHGADYCDVLEQVAREFRSQSGRKQR